MLLSRTVLKRKKNARSVLAAISVHADAIGAEVAARLGPYLPEGVAFDFAALQRGLGSYLEDKRRALESADDLHLAEVANDSRLRRLRDEATRQLHAALLGISNTIDNTYEPGTAEEALGLGTGLRPFPDQTLEIARRAADRLADPEFAFPDPGLRGIGLDPAELRAEIETPLAALGRVLDDLSEEKKKFDRTLQAKILAMRAYDRAFSQVATCLQAMFRMADEDMLAERIRPTVPQAASPDGEDDEAPDEPEEGSDENDDPQPDASADGDDDDGHGDAGAAADATAAAETSS